jgi:hypothetical protein
VLSPDGLSLAMAGGAKRIVNNKQKLRSNMVRINSFRPINYLEQEGLAENCVLFIIHFRNTYVKYIVCWRFLGQTGYGASGETRPLQPVNDRPG